MKKFILLLLSLVFFNSLKAQCTAPSFNVNLSAQTDTTWTLYGQTRGGTCCGSNNCVTFTVTTNPGTELISFDVTSPSPSGSAYYQVNCGTPVSIGTPLCIVGLPSPFTITYCKPGGDHPNYIITASTLVHASQDISIHKTGCVDTLTVTNVIASSVVWTSIYPGAQGAYNSYLSCTAGCTSTLVTPGPNPPPYVDYQVSGNPNISNCGTNFNKDTVRVYFVPNLTATITPVNPIICASSGTSITLTANPSGGATPYNYTWNTGPHTQSITTTVAGTYTVVISDHTKCPAISVTTTIATSPSATFGFSGGQYCKNGTNPSPVYTGNGQAGVFTSSPSGLVFVSATTGVINLSASTPGTYTVTNTIAASGGCPNVSSTAVVTINPFPTMTSATSATICTGGTVNIPLTSSMPSNYSWVAANNLNTSGESITTQTTSTLNNTISNSTASAQVVIYTVTPTATVSGGCAGTSQTVSVTVNPLDNASFTYPSSTNCQTGTYPTPTITGLSGGTFSSTSGLVFVSTSTGVINLSLSTIGSYTVTYTTNGICPNTATFPITITTAPSAIFNYTGSPYCQNSINPFPTFGSGASGGTFTSSGGLVFVNNSTGEINLSASTPGTYTVTNTIPAAAGCSPAVASGTVTITAPKTATFNYLSPYCQNGINPSPTYSGGGVAGTFSSQAGLNINSGTGLVNLSLSTPGTYTVTNTISAFGGCPLVSATATITITALPVATFAYTGTPYCDNGANPVPTFTGGGVAGIFSASSVFLNVDPNSGIVDLSSSVAGGFIVTNTIPAAAGCPAVTATASITITALPLATFSFPGSPYCQDDTDPTPVLGANGSNGIYTATPAGLNINSSAGTIDLSASVAGTYTVTNTISAAAGCPLVSATGTVAITALPIGTFNYAGSPYCPNQSNPLPTFTGGGIAGTFSSQAGLVLNSVTGQINLSASTPGTYTVSNTIAAANGCHSVINDAVVTIQLMDDASFGYPGSTFCQTGTNPSPIITGLSGGIFSSSVVIINSSTGVINLGATPLGTYTVGYTTAGPCPSSSTVSVTITNAPSAAFSYPSLSYCTSGIDPSPVYPLGSSGGAYTSTPGGLVINSNTGGVTLNTSAPNTYTVTNTIAAAGGCAVAVANTTLTINNAAIANANSNQVICFGSNVNLGGAVGGGASSGTWTGGTGIFSPSAGTLNATYTPTSSDSLAGVITLTLTTNDPAGVCPAVYDTMSVTINQPATSNANVNQVICYGTNVVLNGSIGGSASSGTWSGGAGTFSPNDSSLTATYIPTAADSTAGTITLTLSTNDPAGVCPVVSDAMTITVNQPATVNANVNQAICYGSNVTLAGVVGGSASSGTWTGGTGAFTPNAGTLNASYTPTAADSVLGISVLALTTNDPAGICPAVSDTMIITISQPALVNANADQTICYGSSVVLAGTVGGSAYAGTWAGGNGSYSPNDSALTGIYIPTSADSLAGTFTLTLTTNDPAGVCPAVNDAMNITINQPATVNANTNQTICYGSAVTLNGSIGGIATSGTWSGGAGIFSPNTTTLGASYTPTSADSLAGTINLTLTTNDPAGICPAVTDTMAITINQPATVNANADQTICYGTNVVLGGTIGGSATTGTWTGGSGTYSPNANTPGATYTPTAADSLAGTITLMLSTDDPSGVCAAVNDAMTITINQPATVNANVNQIICYGSSVTLAGSIGGSATNGTWTGGNGTYSPNSTTLGATYIPTAADSAAGTITLTLSTNDPAGVCPAVTDAMNISISQPATVNANVDQTICYGSTVTLAGIVGGSANGGTWTGGTGVYAPNSTNLGAVYIPTAADSLAGTITLTLTTNNPPGVCGAVSDVMTITMNQPATVNANVNQTICYGNTVTLAGSIGGSATSGTWSGGGGIFSPNATTLGATYIPSPADSLAGSVTLTLTTNDPAGVCTAVTDVMVITINPLPQIPTVSAPSYTYCQSATVGSITASGNGTIQWSTNPTMTPVIFVGTTYTPTGLPPGTTTYYVSDVFGTGCKSVSTNTVTVTINANPATPTLTTTSYTYCQTSSAGPINSSGSSNTIWSTSPTLNPVIHVGSSYTPSGLQIGVNTFYLADSSSAGCKSTGTATVSVTVYQNPTLNGNPQVDSANCGLLTGGVSGINVSGGTPAYNYQWYNGSTPITGANTATLTTVGAGTYSVNVTDAHGCQATGGTAVFTVPVSNSLAASFATSVTQGNVPLNVVFTNTSVGATNNYGWTLGNGATSISTTTTSTTYTAAGTYTVTMVATNGTCIAAATQTIVVEGEPSIVIPNIFSPNEDGINDLFSILTVGISELNTDIYNRWGTLIGTMTGVNGTWDGKNDKNENFSEGTYYIIVKAKSFDGKTFDKQGFVTLVR